MDITEAYLAKHMFEPSIKATPHTHLHICIVIPCFNESNLIDSLQSLWNCTRPKAAVEVIIVINSPENCDIAILERNKATLKEAIAWIDEHPDPLLRFFPLFKVDLPAKFAGVGLARKIGMDEAAYRLSLVGNNRGIIAGFDADSLCSTNYLVELEQHFQKHPKTPGASIYFEHPTTGSLDDQLYQGICLYELHLRYLNQALRYAGHLYAYHTVGSSFAVTQETYVKQGGMNKRQAGEDFYFIQKIIELGNYTEINTTKVIPSARVSNRVPFGTGAAMTRWKTEGTMKTYSIQAFDDIKQLIALVDSYFVDVNKPSILDSVSLAMREFLSLNDVEDELRSIRSNSASMATFKSRFFRWFNAFRVIKYLNFAHDRYYHKSEITSEASALALKLGFIEVPHEHGALLNFYRNLDKSGFGLTSQ